MQRFVVKGVSLGVEPSSPPNPNPSTHRLPYQRAGILCKSGDPHSASRKKSAVERAKRFPRLDASTRHGRSNNSMQRIEVESPANNPPDDGTLGTYENGSEDSRWPERLKRRV
jgi:hypothetical protein